MSNKRANKEKSKKNIFKYILKIFIVMFIVGVFLMVIALTFFSLYTEEVTDYNFWQSKNSTDIYDRDKQIITTIGLSTDYVTLDEVSEDFPLALVSTEDSKFYSHNGVDILGMIRAFFQTVFTTSSSGGSTLTMQLAKNLFLNAEIKIDKNGEIIYNEDGTIAQTFPYKTKIGYKLQQMVYAWKIEKNYSKEEILENYINLFDFGGPKGIQNASQYYFGVDAKDLSLTQSATLAGMVQLPYSYSPFVDIEASTSRRNIVLERMLVEDNLTQEEYDKAIKVKMEDDIVDPDSSESLDYTNVLKPYLDIVNLELNELFGEEFDPVTANIEVYTSLNLELQEEVYKIINNEYGNIRYESDYLQAGSSTIDTQTGEILAIGGGRYQDDANNVQNYGAFYKRQPGSTSKPIYDYAPAIEFLGWSTSHALKDEKVTYSNGVPIENAYQDYYGTMSIQQGLASSANTIALQTFQQTYGTVGIEKVEEFAKGLGITDSKDINEAYSIGGWNDGTTPLELAGAYAVFGNGGTYNKPHAITKIKFDETSPYYEEYGDEYIYEYESHQGMNASTAFMVTKMLDPTLPYAITGEMYISALGTQGVKTGTSNWAENSYGIPEGSPRDKWVAGYNADLTTVVWTAYSGDKEAEGYYFSSYGLWSYDLYNSIMTAAYNLCGDIIGDNQIVQPDDVYATSIGGINYYSLKGGEAPNTSVGYSIKSEDDDEEKDEDKEKKNTNDKSDEKEDTTSDKEDDTNTTKPDTTDPDTTDPDTIDPDTTDPDTTDPDTTDPDITDPDTTDPDATK